MALGKTDKSAYWILKTTVQTELSHYKIDTAYTTALRCQFEHYTCCHGKGLQYSWCHIIRMHCIALYCSKNCNPSELFGDVQFPSLNAHSKLLKGHKREGWTHAAQWLLHQSITMTVFATPKDISIPESNCIMLQVVSMTVVPFPNSVIKCEMHCITIVDS